LASPIVHSITAHLGLQICVSVIFDLWVAFCIQTCSTNIIYPFSQIIYDYLTLKNSQQDSGLKT